MWGRSVRKKTPVGKKCPLKTVALAIKMWRKSKAIESSQGRAQSWQKPSRAWEASVECRWHGKVVQKRKNKQQATSQKQQWMRNNNQHHKNLTGGSPKQVPSLGVVVEFTKDVRELSWMSHRVMRFWFLLNFLFILAFISRIFSSGISGRWKSSCSDIPRRIIKFDYIN